MSGGNTTLSGAEALLHYLDDTCIVDGKYDMSRFLLGEDAVQMFEAILWIGGTLARHSGVAPRWFGERGWFVYNVCWVL